MEISTLLSLLDDSSQPSSTALILPAPLSQSFSYAQLQSSAVCFRDVLRQQLGVRHGEVVAMSLVNSVEFVIGFMGTAIARAISAPLNPLYSAPEVEFYLADTKPALLLLPPLSSLDTSSPQYKGALAALEAAKKSHVRTAEFSLSQGTPHIQVIFPGASASRPALASAGGGGGGGGDSDDDPVPSDVALVLHTSGTTSRPKSVPLTHLNLLTTTQNIVATYALTPADRTYLVMPLFHVHGLLAGLLAPLRSGGSVVIPERFSGSRFWADFGQHRCTWYTAVPTIHAVVLELPLPEGGVPPIRFIRSCSSSLPPVLMERLETTLRAPVCEAYAMTEASTGSDARADGGGGHVADVCWQAAHQMTSNVVGKQAPGTVGFGIGVEVSIRDEGGREVGPGETGEVCVRGDNVIKGYWNNDKANRESFWEAGWFRTGDEGMILPSGHLKLTGRLKELINRGGEKISPLEVDAALLRDERVAEAVCFGVEDAKYGEVVWAGVVLHRGERAAVAGAEAEGRIRAGLEGRVAGFKIPDRIIVTDVIPKTATGKIQRRFVKETLVGRVRAREERVKARL